MSAQALWTLVGGLAVLLLGAAYEIRRTRVRLDRVMDTMNAERAALVSTLRRHDAKRVKAEVLRDLANRYGSVQETATLNRIAREQYVPGGPDVPALWLRHHADLLDPDVFTEERVAEPRMDVRIEVGTDADPLNVAARLSHEVMRGRL